MVDERNGRVWQAFWKDLPGGAGAAFWDCAPADGAAAHAELFKPYFDPTLPLVDVGCGNGTQTQYLAKLFDRVYGVDVAAAAIERAARDSAADNVGYERLDLLDAVAVAAFAARVGQVNVYLSGVIHQLPPALRVAFAANLATLLGERGHVFDQELTPQCYTYMQHLMADPANDLPKLERVSVYFGIGLQPAAGESKLAEVFATAGLTIVEDGDLVLRTTETLPDGTALDLPTHFVIARRSPA